MKNIKIQIIVLCIVFIVCGSFISIQNREEELKKLSPNAAIISDDCFDSFLKNLNKLGAVIYIPDTKLVKGKELGLTKSTNTNTKSLNSGNTTEAYEFYVNYDQIAPVKNDKDECSEKNIINFNNLKMLVFVDNTKSAEYKKLGFVKVEEKIDGQSFHKLEGKFIKHETIKIKFDNNIKEINYTPVCFKIESK